MGPQNPGKEEPLFRHRFLTSSAVLAVLAGAVTVAPAGAAATSSGGTRMISAGGTTSLRATATGRGALAQPENRSGLRDSAGGGTGSVSPNPAVPGPKRRPSSQHASGANAGPTAS